MKRSIVAFATLFLLKVMCPLNAQVSIEGNLNDIRWFTDHVEKIADNLPSFANLWEDIESFKKGLYPRLVIQIHSKNSSILFGGNQEVTTRFHPFIYGKLNPPLPHFEYKAYRNGNQIDPNGWGVELRYHVLVIDRYDIEQLPQFKKLSGNWIVSDGRPEWFMTQESVIAHELAEFFHGLTNGFCKYRCDCPGGRGDDSHSIGKKVENDVRLAFGQSDFRNVSCGDSNEPKVQFGTHELRFVLLYRDLKDFDY